MNGNSVVQYSHGVFPIRGRLEFLNNGRWGTVCSDNLNDVSAEVSCKHMGMTGGWFIWSGNTPDGIDPIWLDQLSC